MIAYRVIDDIAECYLDLVDALDAEIDELEDVVEDQSAATTRQRISELRRAESELVGQVSHQLRANG